MIIIKNVLNVALRVIVLYPIPSASSRIVYKQFHCPKGHKKCKVYTNAQKKTQMWWAREDVSPFASTKSLYILRKWRIYCAVPTYEVRPRLCRYWAFLSDNLARLACGSSQQSEESFCCGYNVFKASCRLYSYLLHAKAMLFLWCRLVCGFIVDRENASGRLSWIVEWIK